MTRCLRQFRVVFVVLLGWSGLLLLILGPSGWLRLFWSRYFFYKRRLISIPRRKSIWKYFVCLEFFSLQSVADRLKAYIIYKAFHCVKSVRILSYSGPNAGKYGLEKLRIRTLFTQCSLVNNIHGSRKCEIFSLKQKSKSNTSSYQQKKSNFVSSRKKVHCSCINFVKIGNHVFK